MDSKETVIDVDRDGRARRAAKRATVLAELQVAEAVSASARRAYETAYAESVRLHTASTSARLRVLQLQDEYNRLQEPQ